MRGSIFRIIFLACITAATFGWTWLMIQCLDWIFDF